MKTRDAVGGDVSEPGHGCARSQPVVRPTTAHSKRFARPRMDSRLCIETRVQTATTCLSGSSFVPSAIAVSVHLDLYAVEPEPENRRNVQRYGLQRRGECRSELN